MACRQVVPTKDTHEEKQNEGRGLKLSTTQSDKEPFALL